MSEASKLVGKDAPQFKLSNSKGEHVSLAAHQGSPVVLIFFTDNCAWCRTEMPKLGETYHHVKSSLVYVAGVMVHCGETETAARFAKEYELDFPILLDGEGSVAGAFHITRVPTVVIINKDGQVLRVFEGATEQLPGMLQLSIVAAIGGHELPEYSLVGNGCAP